MIVKGQSKDLSIIIIELLINFIHVMLFYLNLELGSHSLLLTFFHIYKDLVLALTDYFISQTK